MYSYEDRIRAVKLYINRQCCSRFTPLRCLPPCSGLRPETPRQMNMIKNVSGRTQIKRHLKSNN